MDLESSFWPAAVDYTWSSRGFVHQYDRDLHVVVLWNRARPREADVVSIVEDRLRVVADYEVQWSPRHTVRNFERLYAAPLTGRSTKHEQVGTGPFRLLVVEDTDPWYGYRSDASGRVRMTNVSVDAVKQKARALFGDGFLVHSSNDLAEFFRNAALILGVDELGALLAGTTMGGRVDRDLAGADGWADVRELLTVLRWSTPFVVMRNFEALPDLAPGDDVDILCADRADLVAVANADLESSRLRAGFVTQVAGQSVKLDVRHVGDGYLDAGWQTAMLARAELSGAVPHPRVDDHLFSLLYHAKIQKPAVKGEYVPRLEKLALAVGLPEPLAATVAEDATAARLLGGYLWAHGYMVPRPDDELVFENVGFVRLLRQVDVASTPAWRLVMRRWSSWARSVARRSRTLRSVYRILNRR